MRTSAASLGYSAAGATLLVGAWLKARLGLDCPLHATTGLLCPACGTTRALAALAHGNLVQGSRDNALFVAVTVLGLIALSTPALRRKAAAVVTEAEVWPTYVAFAVMVAFAVVRNLPAVSVLRPSA